MASQECQVRARDFIQHSHLTERHRRFLQLRDLPNTDRPPRDTAVVRALCHIVSSIILLRRVNRVDRCIQHLRDRWWSSDSRISHRRHRLRDEPFVEEARRGRWVYQWQAYVICRTTPHHVPSPWIICRFQYMISCSSILRCPSPMSSWPSSPEAEAPTVAIVRDIRSMYTGKAVESVDIRVVTSS